MIIGQLKDSGSVRCMQVLYIVFQLIHNIGQSPGQNWFTSEFKLANCGLHPIKARSQGFEV